MTITMNDTKLFIRMATPEQRNELAQFLANRRTIDMLNTKDDLQIGDTVKFTSARKRSPFTYVATLVRKANRRATVRIISANVSDPTYMPGTQVTVPFAMLTKQ
jgi:hypothetical protein